MNDATSDGYRDHAGKRRLPTLDDLRVASPCDVPWSSMQGNGRVRTCAQCDKQVFNIAAMTRADAEVLLTERMEGLCVRLYRRDDGTILTSDCPIGVKARIKSRMLWSAVVTAVLGFLALLGIRTMGTRVTTAVGGQACTTFDQ